MHHPSQHTIHQYTKRYNGKDASACHDTVQYLALFIKQLKLSANYTPHPIHLGKPLGFSILHERSHHTHHGIYWCSNYRNTLTTCATCQRSKGDAIIHWRNASFHHVSTNFIRRCTPFLQISMYPLLDHQWTILITDWCTNTGSCTTNEDIQSI